MTESTDLELASTSYTDSDSQCDGTSRLLELINDYCALYAKRRRSTITTAVFMKFLEIGFQHGFAQDVVMKLVEGGGRKDKIERKRSQRMAHNILNYCRRCALFGIRPLPNVTLAFQEISRLEYALGSSLWRATFVSLFDEELHKNHLYEKNNMTYAYCRPVLLLRDAILNEDWTRVGMSIGRIPSMRGGLIENRKLSSKEYRQQLSWLRERTRAISVILPSIFRAGAQRLLQHNIPRDVFAKSAAELMLVLVNAGFVSSQTCVARNDGLLFAADLLIFLIANQLDEEARDLIAGIPSFPRNAQIREYLLIMRGYNALHRYDVWRRSSNHEADSESYDICDDFSGAIAGVPSGQETVFIDALLHYISEFGLTVAALRITKECCQRSPFMLGHCYRALKRNEFDEEADQLLTHVISTMPELLESISPSDPIFLEWIQPRILNPDYFDDAEEMMVRICKILFELLDYGENRSNERAWGFLWACVQHVREPSVLRLHWDERRSWWPKFHKVSMAKVAEDCRERVLSFLRKLDVSGTVAPEDCLMPELSV